MFLKNFLAILGIIQAWEVLANIIITICYWTCWRPEWNPRINWLGGVGWINISSRKILMHVIYNLSFDCFFWFLNIKVVRRSLEDHARFRYSKSFVISSSSSCIAGIATTTSRCSSLFEFFYYPNNPPFGKDPLHLQSDVIHTLHAISKFMSKYVKRELILWQGNLLAHIYVYMYVCVCVCVCVCLCINNDILWWHKHIQRTWYSFYIILIKQYYIVLQLLDKNTTIVCLVLLMETGKSAQKLQWQWLQSRLYCTHKQSLTSSLLKFWLIIQLMMTEKGFTLDLCMQIDTGHIPAEKQTCYHRHPWQFKLSSFELK